MLYLLRIEADFEIDHPTKLDYYFLSHQSVHYDNIILSNIQRKCEQEPIPEDVNGKKL